MFFSGFVPQLLKPKRNKPARCKLADAAIRSIVEPHRPRASREHAARLRSCTLSSRREAGISMPRKAPRKGQGKSRELTEVADDHDLHSNSDSESVEDADASTRYDDAVNLPAHQSKHLAELVYRFPSISTSFKLVQRNDTNSTGSSLWLSSQVLSSYLLHTYAGKQQGGRRMLELGSGTGLLSLLMARLGWQVTATDIPPVLDSVLEPNVEAGLYKLANEGMAQRDQIQVCELDWMVPPEQLHWHSRLGFPSTREHGEDAAAVEASNSDQHYHLILTADTIYEPSLVRPLLSTISHLYRRQGDESKPTVLLALERRDPAHVTEALRVAKDDFALPFKQVPHKRVRKIFDTLGDGTTWSRADWDGVEIWKL